MGNDLYGSHDAALKFVGHNIVGSAPVNFHSTNTATGDAVTISGGDQTALETVFAHVDLDPHTGVLSGVLADNAGLVQTVAINRTGIAHDAGDTAAAVYDDDGIPATPDVAIPTDARGFDRVAGASVDSIGAFEQQAARTFVVTTLDDELYD